MQPLWRVSEEIPVLMNRTPLSWYYWPERSQRLLQAGRAVDNQELRGPQAAGDQVIEHGPPGRLALPAHAADGQQHLLPVPAHAEDHQQRNRGGLAVQPDPHHGAVQNEADDVLAAEVAPAPGFPVRLHLAPGAADHVLAHRAPEQRRQRPLHPPRVGPGQVGPRNQRLELARPPGVVWQHGAAPFPAAAVLGPQPGPRHRKLDWPERAVQLPPAVPVPMPHGPASPLVAAAPQRRLELLLHQLLNQAADPAPQAGFDGVKPGLPGKQRLLGSPLAAILVHGVVSTGAPTPVMAR